MSKYKIGDVVYQYCGNRLDIIEITKVTEREGYITIYDGKVLNTQEEGDTFEMEIFDVMENMLSPTVFDLIQDIKRNIDKDYYSYFKDALK